MPRIVLSTSQPWYHRGNEPLTTVDKLIEVHSADAAHDRAANASERVRGEYAETDAAYRARTNQRAAVSVA